MANYEEEPEEQLLDRVTRWPPGILATMRLVWTNTVPRETPETLRVRQVMIDDPKSFYQQLVGMENLYQKQVTAANQRDERIRIAEERAERAEARVKELEAELASRPGLMPGEEDQGEERILDLIDRLRQDDDGPK